MPNSGSDLGIILKEFFAEIEKDSRLQTSLIAMKFKCKIDFTNTDSLKKSLALSNDEILAIIVIYSAQDKTLADYLLNKLIEMFHFMKGANLTPRYNKKITDLMYYAQGDGDFKPDDFYKNYYTEDLIFYAKNFEEQGENKNYELTIEPRNLKYLQD